MSNNKWWSMRLAMAVAVTLLVSTGCVEGGGVHVVQGVQFALDDRDSEMADRAEQAQPPPAESVRRCGFWRTAWQRAQNVSPALTAWAQAKTAEACGVKGSEIAQISPGFRFLHYRINGNELIVTAVMIPNGSSARPSDFTPEAPPGAYVRVPNTRVTLVQADMTAPTDANGEARFDLASDPFRNLIEHRDPVRFMWMIRAEFKDGTRQEVAFDPGQSQFVRDEEQAKVASQQATIAGQQAEQRAQQREIAHTASTKALQDVEQGLRQVGPPWTTAHMQAFDSLLTEYNTIDATTLSVPEKTRFDVVKKKVDALLADPRLSQAVSASQTSDDQVYVTNGWTAMKTRLVAPATAALVGSRILLRCPKGRIIQYEFDSQNRMRALLRGKGAVKINASGGFVAWAEGETVGGGGPIGDMSGYGALLLAAQRGDCSQME